VTSRSTSRTTTRAVLATTAATTAFVLSAASGAPALAAAVTHGTGTSSLQVLTLTAGGHTISLGGLALVSDTVGSAPVARVTVTPLVVDATTYGEQVVTPANSPLTVPAVASPAVLSGLATVSSPAITAAATSAPATHAGTTSLGTLSVLGIQVPVNGAVSVGSAVTSARASAQKTVTIKNLVLPSIGDILAQLGLDVSKLPVGTLGSLVNQLDLANSAIAAAQAAVDTAQAQVDAAITTASAAALGLAQANSAQSAAQTALTNATTALQSKLNGVTGATLVAFPGANTISGYSTLSAAGLLAVETLVPGTAAAYTTYTSAASALTTAQGAVATAQGVVNTAQAAIAPLTATLDSVLSTLDGLASALLDSTPLVSLDSLSITSRAVASSAQAGGQTAEVTGGAIEGLHVLGTDVLQTVLGTSSIDVVDLVGGTAATVTTAIGDLTDTLSSVLSSLTGVALNVPAPKIELLTKTTRTWVAGGYGHALASVQGLKVTLPSISLPTSLAVPGAANLAALSGVTQVAGTLTSAPISLELATLSDQSAFAPSVISGPGATPGTGTPGLAATGMPAGLGLLAVLLLGGGLVLRRRRA
jgi:hypothetical protein